MNFDNYLAQQVDEHYAIASDEELFEQKYGREVVSKMSAFEYEDLLADFIAEELYA